ncbi:hypothetical protein [Gemmatimonas sp.]|uniref:hypothetical protein n=1 Tax=Gemmatimonas sp. TaxID=1962908 RepID=UPI0022BD8074|nr:hypothetical protein [Gemmatimonas sp.]MCZ8204589.1 hypothetical protein [Gemmatimonas sp.]
MEARAVMASATRRRRTPLKGRAVVALGLALFLAVTTAVVWRRSTGVRTITQIQRLQEERRSLLAQEKYLESQLRRATSRRTVVQEAQRRLGMVRPGEAQTRFIALPVAADQRVTNADVIDSVPPQ